MTDFQAAPSELATSLAAFLILLAFTGLASCSSITGGANDASPTENAQLLPCACGGWPPNRVNSGDPSASPREIPGPG